MNHISVIQKTLLSTIITAAVLSVVLACESHKKKTYVVGIVNPSSGLNQVVEGFMHGMEKLGYHEGENIIYLYDGPLNGVKNADEIINELLEEKVDLIYSLTTPATKKLKKALAGTNVPGVFGPLFDPVSAEVVESLVKPGGRLTGVKVRGSTPKALDWLLAISPDVRKIFIPFHYTDKAASLTVKDLKDTAAKFGIELVTEKVSSSEDIENSLKKIPEDTDAIWLTCSHLLMSNIEKIVRAGADRGIPVASSTHTLQRSGVLVAYGENDLRLGEQISRLADKLLKGTPPEMIPVENAEYILVVNLLTARELGIKVPDTVLRQADIIIR